MSPHRRLSTRTSRKRPEAREVEDTFLGLAFQLHPKSGGDDGQRDLDYAIVVHDGTGVVESETFKTKIQVDGLDAAQLTHSVREMSKEVLGKVKDYEATRGLKVGIGRF